MIYFKHLRLKKEDKLVAHGGLTLAIKTVDNTLYVGYAKCHSKDNYCKQTGRNLALKRLQNSPIEITTKEVHKKFIDVVQYSILTKIGSQYIASNIRLNDLTLDMLFLTALQKIKNLRK